MNFRKMFSKIILASMLLAILVSVCSATPMIGVWRQQSSDNPGSTIQNVTDAKYWNEAVDEVGGNTLDIVAADAQTWKDANGTDLYWCYEPFPGIDNSTVYHANTDLLEPILNQTQASGKKIILNIQPYRADPVTVINDVLTQYAKYKNCTLGVAVDDEFLANDNPERVNNSQRDAWVAAIKSHLPNGKLYLITYHSDFYNYFPSDTNDTVFMFDGLDATQTYILSVYSKFNYSHCGIYTGYPGDVPRCATVAQIITAQPNTTDIRYAQFDASQSPVTLNWTTPVLPIADFTSNKVSGYAPLNVQFIDLSQNVTSWNWNFGDGRISTSRNPAHTYSAVGNYTVALTATNATGSNTTTKINYINAILKRGGGE